MSAVVASFAFCDLAGYTALAEAHGDAPAADVAGRFADLAGESLAGSARLVKTVGDAVMLMSPDPGHLAKSVLCLLRKADAEPHFPGVRAGMHEGTAVVREGDYFGTAVNLAARVCAYARVGQLLCTARFVQVAEQLVGVEAQLLGEVELRNIPSPVVLYELLDSARAPEARVADPVCRMRLDPESAAARLAYEGGTYYFCSLACVSAFLERPSVYVGTGQAG